VGAACTAVLIGLFAGITNPFWQGSGTQRDAGSEVLQVSRLSDHSAANKAPTPVLLDKRAQSRTFTNAEASSYAKENAAQPSTVA
jgi:hypothetical protein